MNASKHQQPLKEISALYDIYAPAVYGFICDLISDKQEAEAVLTSIFAKLSSEIEEYPQKDQLLVWLINLSRNECISRLVNQNEGTKAALVNDYVVKLPVLQKTVFALAYFKGMNVQEIADLLHVPQKRIALIFEGLPKFTPFLFDNLKKVCSPVPEILQSLVENLVPANDAERVAALKKYQILYTPAEEAFDGITNMVAKVFEAPMAFLSLVDEDTVFYKSQVGPFGKSQVNRESSICSLTILSREPLVIEDASLQGCFKDNPFVQAEGGIKFYAGAPLITPDGYLIGALCVVDTKSRTFSAKDSLLLCEFTEMAMQEIESRHRSFQHALLQEQVIAANNSLHIDANH